MALPLDCFSGLLCAEDCKLIVDDDEADEVGSGSRQNQKERMFFFDDSGFDDTRVSSFLEKEGEMMPREDYLTRLHSGDLDVSARNDSVDWIYKVHRHFNFEPLTVCLSVNYLDRFLSQYELQRGKPWMLQLLSVACVSLAAKMEETDIPSPIDLQVTEKKPVFEARTVQRMELLVLSILKWRTNAVTPLSFIEYFFYKLKDLEHTIPKSLIYRSVELILITAKGVEFLEFRPSEIALAVAISVVGETQTINFDCAFDTCSSSFHLNQERVSKCYELVQEIMCSTGQGKSPPMSPAGVLDAAAFLSYESSLRTSSISLSSSSSPSVIVNAGESCPATKRRKLNL
ncbi:PREDICTED: cyclin-D4-1-like isoform X2 [Nelumbo nucifera]|uniref:Cyclin-D4-1-like isoform X2 n=2 Tax=Nelumbo nucifera TaxID=4432 RepID=A0A1U8B290_NELNU|nr:PREDICTED: cyclin-D4-1-like isoform X2 [Nelumbo nucifera]DAD29613.1 TPA_asm: hypothetical protein HUJ06_031081 [Nelumbo nucifera]